jgi:hypothetical protein
MGLSVSLCGSVVAGSLRIDHSPVVETLRGGFVPHPERSLEPMDHPVIRDVTVRLRTGQEIGSLCRTYSAYAGDLDILASLIDSHHMKPEAVAPTMTIAGPRIDFRLRRATRRN